jgi:hypothetical protein
VPIIINCPYSIPFHVDHLEEITLDELHEALKTVEEKKPTQRLLAAIADENGITQAELAEWSGVGRLLIDP